MHGKIRIFESYCKRHLIKLPYTCSTVRAETLAVGSVISMSSSSIFIRFLTRSCKISFFSLYKSALFQKLKRKKNHPFDGYHIDRIRHLLAVLHADFLRVQRLKFLEKLTEKYSSSEILQEKDQADFLQKLCTIFRNFYRKCFFSRFNFPT